MRYKEIIGKTFGNLKVLDIKHENNKYYALCYCNKFNRWGKTLASHIISGRVKTGHKYKIKDLNKCKNLMEYIKQYAWKYNPITGYFEIDKDGRSISKHKFIVETVLGMKFTRESGLEISYKDGNPQNASPLNFIIQTSFDNRGNNGEYIYKNKRNGKLKYVVKFRDKYYGSFDNYDDAFKKRGEVLQEFNKKIEPDRIEARILTERYYRRLKDYYNW